MSKVLYTQEQVEELLSNQFVKDCTEKYITFTVEFKYLAISLSNRGFSPREIFRDFEFPEYVITSDVPKNALKRWKFNIKNNNITYFKETKKGRKKKNTIDPSKMNKDEYIKYLETKVAYLDEINKIKNSTYP